MNRSRGDVLYLAAAVVYGTDFRLLEDGDVFAAEDEGEWGPNGLPNALDLQQSRKTVARGANKILSQQMRVRLFQTAGRGVANRKPRQHPTQLRNHYFERLQRRHSQEGRVKTGGNRRHPP